MAKRGGLAAVPKAAREQRELECILTPAERDARSDEMAAAELEIEKLKTERSVITRSINATAQSRNKLGHVLDDGRELRMVDCVWHEDLPRKQATLIRTDTNEAVETRALTPAELQTGFALVTGGPGEDSGDDEDDDTDARPTRSRKASAPTHHEHAPPTPA